MRRALICGISGQDGAYLSKLLVDRGYRVFGTSRDAQMTRFSHLETVGVRGSVDLLSMAPSDFRSVLQVIKKVEPDEIYNLAGQSSVGLSFEQPVETMESIAGSTLNLLEAIRFVSKTIRFYNAGSGECFGETTDTPANERTPFRPRSPYAVAKSAAHWQVVNYRDAYDLFACNGILFNHESALRPERFVTKKIVASAGRIARGSRERLALGNLHISRDWGWAPEYVDAMWRMLQASQPDDYVVATGKSVTLQYFVELAFAYFKLDWRDHVETRRELLRPTDVMTSRADPRKAEDKLGWTAHSKVETVVRRMAEQEL